MITLLRVNNDTGRPVGLARAAKPDHDATSVQIMRRPEPQAMKYKKLCRHFLHRARKAAQTELQAIVLITLI